MGKLTYLVIHCTATPECREVSSNDIKKWHILERGWSRVGYSDMVHLDGRLENLIAFDMDDEVDSWEISNGVKGYNGISRHIVYVGGLDPDFTPKDTRTPEQLFTLETYVKYTILRHPEIKVIGHNQVSNKACPGFDVSKWLRLIGVNEKNIGL